MPLSISQDPLVGERFGSWIVVAVAPRDRNHNAYFHCVCDCGTKRSVLREALVSGKSTSCGCSRRAAREASSAAMIGKTFGRLTVLSEAVTPNTRHRYYVCQCVCGEFDIIRGLHLRNGITQSCGCLSREVASERTRLGQGEAAFNTLYGAYRAGARNRGLVFDLDKETFRVLTQQVCYYCGTPPSQIQKVSTDTGDYIYTGIDRVNNDLGYIAGNMVPCCGLCNRAKHTLSAETFIALARRICAHHCREDE